MHYNFLIFNVDVLFRIIKDYCSKLMKNICKALDIGPIAHDRHPRNGDSSGNNDYLIKVIVGIPTFISSKELF